MADARFSQESGYNVYNGNELIVKGCFESGVGLIAGYPGSPVAEIFTIIEENSDLLKQHGLWGELTNDEAQGAAAVNGAVNAGVDAVAVMKSVGLNVAADPLNIIGYAHKEAGALVVCGDDPHASSTQVASDSRQLLEHLKMPVLEPSTPQEIKDWIAKGIALSRFSDLVVGFLVTTFQAEGGGNVEVRPNKPPQRSFKNPVTIDTSKWEIPKTVSIPPYTWDLEKELVRVRMPRAIMYAQEQGLNRVLYADNRKRRIGFVAGGISYTYVESSLHELGLGGKIPILKLGLTYPIDPEIVAEFCTLVDEVIVVEEKSPFIENQVKTIIKDHVESGRLPKLVPVWGKKFPDGLDGFPEEGGLMPSLVLEKIGLALKDLDEPEVVSVRSKIQRELNLLQDRRGRETNVAMRTPGFCAGCPHRETLSAVRKVRENPVHKDIFPHGDIGCYSMAFLPPFGEMFNLTAMALGGAAGAGMDPFVTNKQYVLMGDSTFFWRGMTAISNSVKEGQDILYIILDNKNTAMTGHQPTPASGHNIMGETTTSQSIDDIARAIGEGKKGRFHRVKKWLGYNGDFYLKRLVPSYRDDYIGELERAFEKPGVKVIIADKECGITFHRRKRAERQRIIREEGFLRKEVFVNISPEVCENCRECTKNTGCPGLTITNTSYGEKIAIDMSTCVADTYCTKTKACPSFEKVIVERRNPPQNRAKALEWNDLPPVEVRPLEGKWSIFICGVGGMGVGVLSSVLARAGGKQGYSVWFNDKKGLAIRNGSVQAHVIYGGQGTASSNVIHYGKTNLLMAVDMLEGARTLMFASEEYTNSIVNTAKVPTIPMLAGMMDYPDNLEETIRKSTHPGGYFGTRIGDISEVVFGNRLFSNIIMLGVAYQKGLIPVSLKNLEESIGETISPAQRERNLKAFHFGRRLAIDPNLRLIQNLVTDPRIAELYEEVTEDYDSLLAWKTQALKKSFWLWWKGSRVAEEYRKMVDAAVSKMGLDREFARDVARRVYDLIQWGGVEYARRYLDRVLEVWEKDRAERGFIATKRAIWNLHKVMAIKDELYVSHLLTDPEKLERDKVRYNVDPKRGDRIKYIHINRPHFELFGKSIEFDMNTRNWLLNIFKRARWLRPLLSRWGWHKREQEFREWYHRDVVGYFLENSGRNYDRALSALRVIEDIVYPSPSGLPVKPGRFSVTGFREVIYPKMEKAQALFEKIRNETIPAETLLPVLA